MRKNFLVWFWFIICLFMMLFSGCSSGELTARTGQKNNNKIDIGDLVIIDGLGVTGKVNNVMERMGDGYQWANILVSSTNGLVKIDDIDVAVLRKIEKLEN